MISYFQQDHTHQLDTAGTDQPSVWRCRFPGCTHTVVMNGNSDGFVMERRDDTLRDMVEFYIELLEVIDVQWEPEYGYYLAGDGEWIADTMDFVEADLENWGV